MTTARKVPELTLEVQGMSCASCVAHVEKALLAVPGVSDASVNLALQTASVRGPALQIRPLVDAVEAAGYHASVRDPATTAGHTAATLPERRAFWIAALLSAPLLLPMLAQWLGWHLMLGGTLQWVLATPVQFWAGWRFYRGAWAALQHHTATMDTLVTLGTSAAYGLSLVHVLRGGGPDVLYFEAGSTVITLILLGKWLEARARHQTMAAIRALQNLRPALAWVRGEAGEREVPAADLRVGDLLLVRPGERVAADGEIVSGSSHLDEALLTGESTPQLREAGARVLGGAINLDGPLEVRVAAIGAETLLARILRLVEQAQTRKAPVQQLADRVSALMVPAVLCVAGLTLLGWGWGASHWEQGILNAVSVLIIACPCALGLATPTALLAGTGIAAQHGILIRDAAALERARALDVVAFDKTGTLTQGRPRVRYTLAADGSETELLRIAAALQRGSEHPLAGAVQQAAQRSRLVLPAVQGLQTLPGRGVTAELEGRRCWFGNRRLLEDVGVPPAAIAALGARLPTGLTSSWLARREPQGVVLLGAVLFEDTLRETAGAAVAALRTLGIHTLMLSGDNQAVADAIAVAVGLDEVRANVLPEQKAEILAELQQQGRVVGMVGDGINDAPALAQADVGIAMGAGTDVAMQTAGITLMRSDPLCVADAIAISRQTCRKIRQNLFWAFVYNLLGIPLAAFGLLSPMLAGALMALSSVSVVSNALLLRYWRPYRRPRSAPVTGSPAP